MDREAIRERERMAIAGEQHASVCSASATRLSSPGSNTRLGASGKVSDGKGQVGRAVPFPSSPPLVAWTSPLRPR